MLSNLYLGLIKDASVGEEARGIVLQALFARSDTGLPTPRNKITACTCHDRLDICAKFSAWPRTMSRDK